VALRPRLSPGGLLSRCDATLGLRTRAVLKRFEERCYWVREELPVKETILDGEVVALDSGGRQNFRDLRAGRGNLRHAAFDALWIEGKDLRPLLLTGESRS
jgi:ATP-dependent DNA ligase